MTDCTHRWRLVQDDDFDCTLMICCEHCDEYGEHTDVNEKLDTIEAQVAELLAVCEELMSVLDSKMTDLTQRGIWFGIPMHKEGELNESLKRAKAAIAKGKENNGT